LSARLIDYTAQGSSSSNPVPIQNVDHLKGYHFDPCNIGDCNKTVSGAFADTYHLSISWPILVPAGLGVSFAVNFHVEYSIDNGRVGFDFDSPGRFIMCPGVQMDLLTAPQVTVA
jgi:hypothetical protein